MALRYDGGTLNAVEESDEGFLILKGAATRTGVFRYRNLDGTERLELRHPDDVLDPKSLKTLAGKPFTVEHPPELVTPRNVDTYSRGSVNNRVEVVGNGLIEVVINVHHQDAIDEIKLKRKQELSCGYNCDVVEESGVFDGERYTHRQRNIVYNHLSLVEKGRAGEICSLRVDSESDPDIAVQVVHGDVRMADQAIGHSEGNPQKPSKPSKLSPTRMATLRIDSVDYPDVPETVAAQVSLKLKELEQQRSRADAAEQSLQEKEEEVETLTDELDSAKSDLDREKGKSQGLEYQVEDLEFQLEEARSTEEPEAKTDTACLSEDAIEEGIREGIKARTDAMDFLSGRGIDIKTVNFDGAIKPVDVKRVVIKALRPNLNLDSKNDSQIEERYDALQEEASPVTPQQKPRRDAEGHVDGARTAITDARKTGTTTSSTTDAVEEVAQRKAGNCKKPLAMSKDR